MDRDKVRCKYCGDPWFEGWCKCTSDDHDLNRQIQRIMGAISALLCRARSLSDESHKFDLNKACHSCIRIMTEFDDDLVGFALVLVDGTIQYLAKNDLIKSELMPSELLYSECCGMIAGWLDQKAEDIEAAHKLSEKK